MPRVRGEAEDRDARALAGKLLQMILFMDVTVGDMKALRGPSIARPEKWGRPKPRRSPFTDRTRPMAVMLDPALDLSNPVIDDLLKLVRHSDVVRFYDSSLSTWDELPGVKRVSLTEHEARDGAPPAWSAALDNTRYAVWLCDPTIVAPKIFGEVDRVGALECMAVAEAGSTVGCDVYLTTNPTLLGARVTGFWWTARIGPLNPLELFDILGPLFRQAGVLPTSSNSTAEGGVHDLAIQRLIPAYLGLYRSLCRDEDGGGTLRYMDGLLGNCVLALMALDRLAGIHFDEDLEPANNVSVAQQQYESASFVVAATAALEGLTWVLFRLAGASADRRRVTFRKLIFEPKAKQDVWVDAVCAQFPDAVCSLRERFGMNLAVALHFRDLLQHHFPIPVAVAEFRDTSIVINGEPRFSDKWKVGVLLIEPHVGERPLVLSGTASSGILPDSVMPYPFLRQCARDLYDLVEATLAQIPAAGDASQQNSNTLWYEDGFLGVDERLIDMLTLGP